MSLERAKPSVTGSRMATMAVLFIHALKNAETSENARIAQRTLPESRSRSNRPMWSTAPERSRAPPMTNKAAIVSGASFLKTSVIFSAGHQAQRHHQAEDREREHVRRRPFADERDKVRTMTSRVRTDFRSHGEAPPRRQAASMNPRRPFGKSGCRPNPRHGNSLPNRLGNPTLPP